MKVLIRELLKSWHLWSIVVSLLVGIAILVTLAIWLQRADSQRQLDATALQLNASAMKTVQYLQGDRDRILKAIADLKVKDQQSAADRKAIKRTVEQLKSEVQDR